MHFIGNKKIHIIIFKLYKLGLFLMFETQMWFSYYALQRNVMKLSAFESGHWGKKNLKMMTLRVNPGKIEEVYLSPWRI
jgi:Leu/Phe-tRNA-protein transferase